VQFNRSLIVGAFVCVVTSTQLLASDDLPSDATSFAYAISHAVTPLPDAVIARVADTDGGELSDDPASEELAPKLPAEPARPISRTGLCSAMVSVARANGLPAPFFANLIWQESGFNAKVVSSAGAQGIAQFMPETAKEYGLVNPFDPIHAINAAGKFLNRLVAQFGNLGLAAAAYNAGPGRVSDYVAKRRGLPEETRNYVMRITGKAADKWTSKKFVQAPEAKVMPAKAPCVETAQEVAGQAKAVQLAQLAAAQAAKQTGKLSRAPKTIRTAAKQVKGRAVVVLAGAKKRAAAPIKLADRIVPDKSAAHGGSIVSRKAGKTLVNKTSVDKTSVAKASQKPAHATKRTRVASAR
jgi:transglycosylase-like protein with SLT domain